MTTHFSFKKLTAILFVCVTGFIRPSFALLKIDVSGAGTDPLPIALPYFGGQTEETRILGKQLTEIIENDLTSSGLFRSVNRDAFIDFLYSSQQKPSFPDWTAIKTAALLYGDVSFKEDGRLNVSFRLFDVFASKQIEAASFTSDAKSIRRLAHLISDTVYKRLTGEKGYFDTRIAYVAETGHQTNRQKRLAIMDRDGADVVYLTSGQYMILTPRFSPDAKKVTYLSYQKGAPKVFLYDLTSGERSIVGHFPGMTFAPRFSPDGKSLLMSFSRKGNSEIYLYNLETKATKRLTKHPAIDTSPCFSPDGKHIVFNSDRGGSQQLYIMKKDGSDVRRLTFQRGSYATPVWSPRGDYIAFTKMKGGQFYIGLIRPDGSGERLIADGFLTESPSFSPNGRRLLFYRARPFNEVGTDGQSRLFSIDITGQNEQEVPTETDASDPAWSPLLSEDSSL